MTFGQRRVRADESIRIRVISDFRGPFSETVAVVLTPVWNLVWFRVFPSFCLQADEGLLERCPV